MCVLTLKHSLIKLFFSSVSLGGSVDGWNGLGHTAEPQSPPQTSVCRLFTSLCDGHTQKGKVEAKRQRTDEGMSLSDEES